MKGSFKMFNGSFEGVCQKFYACTPFGIVYLGIMVHTKLGKWEQVDRKYEFGLSFSYKCELEISTELSNKIFQCYKKQKLCAHPANCMTAAVTTLTITQLYTS